MVDVVFDEPQLSPISARKSDGFLVMLLVRSGIAKSVASARVILLATGLICFSAALFLFLRTVNEPPLNTQRVIPPGFENQQS
ncbi:MAG: hypothetical protein AMXMBFR44_6200 [Candidatus Campbellbacteria bacterium]